MDGVEVNLLNAHFKSKLISDARRRPDGPGSRFRPGDEDERYRYVAYTLYLRTGEAMTIRDRLNALLSAGSSDQGDGYRLWNPAPLLNRTATGEPLEAPFTRRFKGRGELIDHIFASHRLVNATNLPLVKRCWNP